MFPQLVAGPIVRYSDIFRQLKTKNISRSNFSEGVERFIIGLAKKVIIANFFASIADAVFSTAMTDLSSLWAWIGVISYSIQIYFDFSGYSDMAIGLGKMFGFDFPENFNFPYIAKSIKEFWRRWHISLSSWFRDYVYISLGGNRVGTSRLYLNLLLVFFITGLWHGASWNFVIWGLFHGLFLIIERLGLEKALSRIWRPAQHLYALLIVSVGWVFFRTPDINTAFVYLKKMFSMSSGNIQYMDYFTFSYINGEFVLLFVAALIFSIPLSQLNLRIFGTETKERFKRANLLRNVLNLASRMLLLITSLSLVASDSYNPFIYFRF